MVAEAAAAAVGKCLLFHSGGCAKLETSKSTPVGIAMLWMMLVSAYRICHVIISHIPTSLQSIFS